MGFIVIGGRIDERGDGFYGVKFDVRGGRVTSLCIRGRRVRGLVRV